MGSIKKFIGNLLSDSTEVSHKRLIALLSFIVLVAMVALKAKGYQLDQTLVMCFGSLCGVTSFLSVVEKKINKGANDK